MAGTPVDGVSENSPTIDLNINFSCYSDPTVIKTPKIQPAQSEFTYTIGGPDLNVQMVSDDGAQSTPA